MRDIHRGDKTVGKKGVAKKKSRYKISNWKEYNESLVNRYDITVWIKNGWVKVWEEQLPKKKRKQGGQRRYSDATVECLLTIKYLFRVPYRGIEGLARSLFNSLLQVPVPIPDYSTIQRRQKGLRISIKQRTNHTERIDIVFDTTGLKVYGEGEWVVRKYGKSYQRTWRKIHIGMNPATGIIEAVR